MSTVHLAYKSPNFISNFRGFIDSQVRNLQISLNKFAQLTNRAYGDLKKYRNGERVIERITTLATFCLDPDTELVLTVGPQDATKKVTLYYFVQEKNDQIFFEELGRAIAAARHQSVYSQRTLATKAGMTYRMIEQVEQALEPRPMLKTLDTLAVALSLQIIIRFIPR
jgi:DNA-binding XRE family transcriptional regulator